MVIQPLHRTQTSTVRCKGLGGLIKREDGMSGKKSRGLHLIFRAVMGNIFPYSCTKCQCSIAPQRLHCSVKDRPWTIERIVYGFMLFSSSSLSLFSLAMFSPLAADRLTADWQRWRHLASSMVVIPSSRFAQLHNRLRPFTVFEDFPKDNTSSTLENSTSATRLTTLSKWKA